MFSRSRWEDSWGLMQSSPHSCCHLFVHVTKALRSLLLGSLTIIYNEREWANDLPWVSQYQSLSDEIGKMKVLSLTLKFLWNQSYCAGWMTGGEIEMNVTAEYTQPTRPTGVGGEGDEADWRIVAQVSTDRAQITSALSHRKDDRRMPSCYGEARSERS